MKIHEECGIFGIFSPQRGNVYEAVYRGLFALQHRGQEGCGIVVCDDGLFYSHKDVGLLCDVFDDTSKLPEGNMAIGHVRYSTTGGASRINCQPIEVNHRKGHMAVAHNGNLSNAFELRNSLELTGAIFHTTSDTETIAYLITKERLGASSVEQALCRTMDIIDGAYSLVLMSPSKMIAARDPYGFRPLCYGKMPDGSFVVSSESCALAALGAEFIRDLLPGEILVFSHGKTESIKTHCGKKPKKTCIFEYIYFARPDSVIDGVSVHNARKKAGAILAELYPAEADLVIGVPDSGIDAALGFAEKSGIPYETGLIKNKYIGRTFILPGQKNRTYSIKLL